MSFPPAAPAPLRRLGWPVRQTGASLTPKMQRPMLRRLIIYLFGGLAGAGSTLALLTFAAAEPVYPTGERIGLEPPPGLLLSKRFPGFEDPDRKVAITILDLPGPAYAEMQKSLFDKDQTALTVDKRELFTFASGVGYLITGHGVTEGVEVRKWLLLASVPNSKAGQIATLVNVQVPEAVKAAYPDKAIRAALATVSFRPAPTEERLKLLPFKLDDLAGFRVMQVMPGSVMLTDGPADSLNQQPYMVVGVGTGSATEPAARARAARDLLAGAPLRDLEMTSGEAMRIGGSPGYEIRAKGKALDGAPISLVQWVRFGSGGYLQIVGVAYTEDWDRLFTRFRAVRDGIELH